MHLLALPLYPARQEPSYAATPTMSDYHGSTRRSGKASTSTRRKSTARRRRPCSGPRAAPRLARLLPVHRQRLPSRARALFNLVAVRSQIDSASAPNTWSGARVDPQPAWCHGLSERAKPDARSFSDDQVLRRVAETIGQGAPRCSSPARYTLHLVFHERGNSTPFSLQVQPQPRSWLLYVIRTGSPRLASGRRTARTRSPWRPCRLRRGRLPPRGGRNGRSRHVPRRTS